MVRMLGDLIAEGASDSANVLSVHIGAFAKVGCLDKGRTPVAFSG